MPKATPSFLPPSSPSNAMDLATVKPFPDLPTDVARSILEIAAYDDRCTAERLTRVSKIIRQWIDPILHHTIVIKTASKLDKFHLSVVWRNDPVFFARHVKVLLIGDYKDGSLALSPEFVYSWKSEKDLVTALLSIFHGLEHLAFWLPDHNLSVLADSFGPTGCIHLTHLSVLDIAVTAGSSLRCWPQSLTHLHMDEADVYSDEASMPWQEIFARCPKLTHICVSGSALSHHFPSNTLLPWLNEAVERLPSTVTTFVILLDAVCLSRAIKYDGIENLKSTVESLIKISDRVVVITQAMDESYKLVDGVYRFPREHSVESDWGDGCSTMDTWELADRCIAERERERERRRGPGKLNTSTTLRFWFRDVA